jgi:hypothetical protein
MSKKLHISLIFSNLGCSKILKSFNHYMCNLYVKFVKFLEIFLATDRSILSHQKLYEDNKRLVCQNNRQNHCTNRFSIYELH